MPDDLVQQAFRNAWVTCPMPTGAVGLFRSDRGSQYASGDCGVYQTKAQAHRAIASYIHGFYNSIRLHSVLGYLSPK